LGQVGSMETEGNLYSQQLWDQGYMSLEFDETSPDDPVALWLKKWAGGLPNKGSCFEVGCFPGRYLAVMGQMGFQLNGTDLTPRTDTEMKAWLQSRGYAVGKISRDDFFRSTSVEKYDAVYSLGFIEHFSEWRQALAKHAEMVKEGGLLLVAAPNFAGAFQRRVHRYLDTENFHRHHLPAMNPDGWRREAENLGFEIIDCGYFGGLDFWIGDQVGFFKKLIFRALWTLKPLMRIFMRSDSPSYSAFCGIVARKKNGGS
jgi:2-polyprenyl-3-methyl-5-hydroxy-6-metoxy-1,4-benzoquinol methylase